MHLKEKLLSLVKNKSLLGLYSVFGGLSECYAFFFAASGIILAFRGKLDGNFAAMIVAIQGLLVAHDSIDDFFQHKKEQMRNTDSPSETK